MVLLPASLNVIFLFNFLEVGLFVEGTSVGADPDKPKCRKAKVVRMERKHQKFAARGIEVYNMAAVTYHCIELN